MPQTSTRRETLRRIWCGPVVSEQLSKADNLHAVTIGTEHIYVNRLDWSDSTDDQVLRVILASVVHSAL